MGGAIKSGSQRRDCHVKTWDRIPQMERRQVQRPWGRDQPDSFWEGERVFKEAELVDRAGVVAAHKPGLYRRQSVGKGNFPPQCWAGSSVLSIL